MHELKECRFLMFWFGIQRSLFFSCKACGPWANAPKIRIKLCFTWRTQCQHCQARGWQDMKVMQLSLFLPPSLSLTHIFGTIIPLFNSVVWSCFTPVQLHWLLFCPISLPLIRLCVINIDRQKKPVHIGALTPPRCQRWSSTPHSCTLNSLSGPPCIVPPLSAESNAKVVGFHSLWLTHTTTMAPCCTHTRPAKRGITAQ